MPSFLISRFVASLPYGYGGRTTQLGLGFLHLHDHSAFIALRFFASSRLYESNHQNLPKDDSFTVSYLMNSCGLSAKAAIEASKRVKLINPNNADSVLNLLRDYGFSETHISKFVKSYPKVILARPEKTLLPKLSFWHSVGFSRADLPEVLVASPRLMLRSLEKFLIPVYEVLKSVLVDNEHVLNTIKRYRVPLANSDIMGRFLPNIKLLRETGVPQSGITFLVTNYPEAVFEKHAKFVECVKSVKEIGIYPSKTTFVVAIQILTKMTKSTWDKKMNVYETLGWTRDVTLSTFKKYPHCMMLSAEKVTKSMTFLLDEMGCSPLDIALNPAVLSFNLKQRIIPRWSVVKILKMKGLVKNELRIGSIVFPCEKKFLERFVIKYQEQVPLLLKVYEAQIDPLHETLS